MSTTERDLSPYDGILLLSFGGPEAPEAVLPFLRRVTAGRGIPDERLAEVGEHYLARGGVSPINDECRELLAALRSELSRRELDVPLAWGNRNAEPYLVDALRELHETGARHVLVILTSAFAGYSSCRQYREDLAGALAGLAAEGRAMSVDKIRPYALTTGFVTASVRLLAEHLRPMPEGTRIVFVTHSVPVSAAQRSGPPEEHGREGGAYLRQHHALKETLLAQVGAALGRELAGELVFCSRSGPASQPWLEPDINEHLAVLAAEGVTHVAVHPIGFVSDHMEVVHDLDSEAAATAAALGITMVRVPTVRTSPEHVTGLVDLACERAAEARREDLSHWRRELGADLPSTCAPGCCPGRTDQPAVAGTE